MEKEKKTQKVKKTGNNANKKIPIFVIGICILVIAVIAIINIVLNNVEYKKYEKYEEKMNKYGFNKLYDNGSAKTSEKVTKSEALKVIIGTCLNTSSSLRTNHRRTGLQIFFVWEKHTAHSEEI